MRHSRNNPESTPFLFVYGTLMKGFREDWQRRAGADFVGQGTIRAILYDLGDYPGARVAGAERGQRVSGELYRLRDPERALKILDGYEQFFPLEPHRSLFVRELVSVTLEDGLKKRAWVFLYNRVIAKAKLIPTGRYRDCANSRPVACAARVPVTRHILSGVMLDETFY